MADADRHRPPGSSEPPNLADREEQPWVETPAGTLFFVNALLVAPELIVLFPLIVGVVLRGLGLLEGPSRFIDTIPQMAAFLLPTIGWLLVVPMWTVRRNLRMEGLGTAARRALRAMLGIHLAFFAYTVWQWTVG